MAVSEAQKAAQKRYNEKNRAERARLRDRSATRSFIRNKADLTEIEELRTMLNERESLLKIKELKERIDRSRHDFPQIIIYDNKAHVTKVLRESVIEEEEDIDDLQQWIDDLIGRFDDAETIIEVDLGNGEPRYFAADEWADIDEYTN